METESSLWYSSIGHGSGQADGTEVIFLGIFSKTKVVNRVVLLDVEQIKPNPAQPRAIFVKQELQDLAESIRENGILQPLTVRTNANGEYELIAGERRLRAAKLVNLKEVPCIVMESTDKQSAVYALIENIQRQNLNYFEEAAAISNLIVEWNVTQEEASKRLGKAQSTVANKIRLLRFHPEQQQKILDAGLTERHARALLKLEDPMLVDKAIYYISARHLNVQQSEKYIQDLLQETKKPHRNYIPVIKDVRLFLNTINKAIETMQKAGVPATTEKREQSDCIEYIVKIPLSK